MKFQFELYKFSFFFFLNVQPRHTWVELYGFFFFNELLMGKAEQFV